MVAKEFERNENWIKRENGRIPTKGAMAAERASAGLGLSEDDIFFPDLTPPRGAGTRPEAGSQESGKE
jgi:hypothetical protein